MSSCTSVKRAAEGFLSRVSPPNKSSSPDPSEVERYDPPLKARARVNKDLESLDGSRRTGGALTQGESVLVLEKRIERCRVEVPTARGWVDCNVINEGRDN